MADVTITPPQKLGVASGRGLMMQRTESADRPVTALYDAGAYGIYADGMWVAEALAARGISTVSYTRAGLYGSDPMPEGENPDPFFHARDMARLLDVLGINTPILLVGHSMAGLRLRAFAILYPERLSGLLFLDAVTPVQLGWTVRREIVRHGSRVVGACGDAAQSGVGRWALRHFPNFIGLEGRGLEDKIAAWSSASHLSRTRAEILASTAPSLAPKFVPLPNLPAGAVTATIVANGTKEEEGMKLLHLPRMGHAAMLRPAPAAKIADFALDILGTSTEPPASQRITLQG